MSALDQQWGGPVGLGWSGSRRSKSRAKLQVVPRSTTRLARVPFLLVLMAIFGVGMAGLLMLNTKLQNQAFEARALNQQATELAYTEASLERQVEMLRAPQELARRASALGLRPNPYPAFLILPKGKIVGKAKPVTGHEVPSLIIKTPEQLAADRAEAKQRAEAKKAEEAKKAKEAAEAKKAKQAADAKKAAEAKKAEAKKAEAKKKLTSRERG